MRCLGTFAAYCLTFTLTIVAFAADPVTVGADPATSHRAARVNEQKVLEALHKKIKAQWTDTALRDIVKSIAKEAGVNLWLDTAALGDEGLDFDAKVSLDLGETSIWTALEFLLDPHGLAWTAQDGVLRVTTKATAAEQMTTRVYNVASLVGVLEPDLRNSEFRQALKRDHEYGSFFAHELGLSEQWPEATFSPMESKVEKGALIGDRRIPGETFLKVILKTSCNVCWNDCDFEGGEITCLRGQLVIRQRHQSHLEIQAVLAAAEDFLLKGVKAKSLEIRRPGYPIDEDAAIVQRLAEPTTVDIAEQPLDGVLRQLAKSAGIRYWLDLPTLNNEGQRPDQKVSVNQAGVPLGIVLKQLLEPNGLTTVVHEGTLVVTSQSKADEMKVIVAYEIGGLTTVGTDELITSIEQSTSGRWFHGGGSLQLVGSRLLLIRQTSKVHSEIAGLLDDLRKNANVKLEPAKALEQRIYTVADATALADLVRSLPILVPNWDAKGACTTLGQCLMVNQPPVVQNRVGEIIGALNSAHARLRPPPVLPMAHPVPPAPGVSSPVVPVDPQRRPGPPAAAPVPSKPVGSSTSP